MPLRNHKPFLAERGYACIGLYSPKDAANIGGALRAAFCYDAALVLVQGKRYQRHPTDTPCASRHLPLLHVTSILDAIPHECVPVGVELTKGARPLTTYIHPERALYIFGPEDSSLGHEILSKCRDTVYIPTRTCMNLAATVNVVLYDRLAKGSQTWGLYDAEPAHYDA